MYKILAWMRQKKYDSTAYQDVSVRWNISEAEHNGEEMHGVGGLSTSSCHVIIKNFLFMK